MWLLPAGASRCSVVVVVSDLDEWDEADLRASREALRDPFWVPHSEVLAEFGIGPSDDAALNNAEWCDAVCRAHGRPGRFGTDAWTNPLRTPPMYPDAVTLTPDASPEDVLPHIDTAPGCSVKDSFASLDLSGAGFEVLFDAQWIHHPAPEPSGPPWEVTGELADWQPPALLADDTVRIYPGAVLNRSATVVGLSNLVESEQAAAWAGALTTAAAVWPGLPVVGYERGPSLDAALRAGFTAVGPLRVWFRPDQGRS